MAGWDDELTPQWARAIEVLRSEAFAEHTLPEYLRRCRWFGGKAQALRSVQAQEVFPLGKAGCLIFLQASYFEAPPETYLLPLQMGAETSASDSMLARFESADGGGVLFDALDDEDFRAFLMEIIMGEQRLCYGAAELVGICSAAFKARMKELVQALASRALKTEQSNSTIIYGDQFFLKLYRRPERGENPDVELLRYLSGRRQFANVPCYYGAIECRVQGEEPRVLALLVEHVPNEGDAWKSTLRELGRYYERVKAQPKATDPALIDKMIGSVYPARARQLGECTAQMHLALAADSADPDFASEAFTGSYQESLGQDIRTVTQRMMQLFAQKLDDLPASCRLEAEGLLRRESEILRRQTDLMKHEIKALRIRLHGDYHLGQVLDTGNDFIIIDFEGEPARPLHERRIKHSPLRDVASMLRSFDYAAHAAAGNVADFEAWAEVWVKRVGQEFLDAYFSVVRGTPLLPEDGQGLQRLLEVCLLEKAAYELCYELNNRPDWVAIPLRGITRLLDRRPVA